MTHFNYAVKQVNQNQEELAKNVFNKDTAGIEDDLTNLLFYDGVLNGSDEGECEELIDNDACILSRIDDFSHAPSLFDILYALVHEKADFSFDKKMIKPLKENLASYNHDVKFWQNDFQKRF